MVEVKQFSFINSCKLVELTEDKLRLNWWKGKILESYQTQVL